MIGRIVLKKFNYYGQEITVPDYAKFVATDKDGEVWWYTNKPNDAYDVWIVGKKGNCFRCGRKINIKNWRGSLKPC